MTEAARTRCAAKSLGDQLATLATLLEVSDPPMDVVLSNLVQLLESGRFDLTSEARTQRDIDQLLASELGPALYRREFVLGPRERPDFMVAGGIAVEVKHLRATPASILRQLKRYAAHDQVSALVLVTGRPVGFPCEVGGKPLRVVGTGAAWL